jgi:hypothetical protein
MLMATSFFNAFTHALLGSRLRGASGARGIDALIR